MVIKKLLVCYTLISLVVYGMDTTLSTSKAINNRTNCHATARKKILDKFSSTASNKDRLTRIKNTLQDKDFVNIWPFTRKKIDQEFWAAVIHKDYYRMYTLLEQNEITIDIFYPTLDSPEAPPRYHSYEFLHAHPGVTPLMNSVSLGIADLVRYFLRQGANIDAQDERGWTAVIYAATHGNFECLKILLEHKANVDATTQHYASTALMHSAGNGHADCVQLLIDHGADTYKQGVDITREKKVTALDYAREQNHSRCVQILEQAKAHQ